METFDELHQDRKEGQLWQQHFDFEMPRINGDNVCTPAFMVCVHRGKSVSKESGELPVVNLALTEQHL